MTLLATIVVLGVLIFVHELGHFWAAKAVGIRVERFSLGLGPRVAGFQRGETEYVISAVPLGGYVKMGGMDDEVMDRLEGGGEAGDRGEDGQERPAREPSPRDFDAKPLWARAFVISAGVIMNFVFAFVAYTAASGLWGLPVQDTDRVGDVVAAQLPAGTEDLARIPAGARILRIGDRRVEDWRDVRAALREGEPGTVVVEAVTARSAEESSPEGSAGGGETSEGPDGTADPDTVAVTIEIPAAEAERRRVYGALVPWLPPVVGAVNPGSPADRGGLEGGDVIVAVDGTEVAGWPDFVREIQARPGQRTELRVQRDGRELTRVVTPESIEERDPVSGERTTRGQVGIYASGGETVTVRLTPVDAVRAGAQETVAVTWLILDFLGDLFTGDVSPRSVGSVFTIGEASGQAVRAGMDTFLRFMAFFSVNLAILNLLPIPVLDGGHLLFLGIEAVRGRALSVEQRIRWSQVGFLIVVALMVWALSNDVLRLLGL